MTAPLRFEQTPSPRSVKGYMNVSQEYVSDIVMQFQIVLLLPKPKIFYIRLSGIVIEL